MPQVMDESSTMNNGNGLLLMISGPSGVGKSTLIQRLHGKFDFVFSVSATTRKRTKDEVDGVDYYFIDEKTFKQWIEEDRFLEHAIVFDKYFYGTPAKPVQDQLQQGRIVVLDIDVQGASQVRAHAPDALGVFILPPSEEVLHQRLIGRGREEENLIEQRFSKARSEIEEARKTDIFDALIVNDDLERATAELDELLMARLRTDESEDR